MTARAQNNSAATRALRRIGQSLCKRYRITRLIGIGGTSAVYAGVHRNGHDVAIKVLHERLSDVPDVERRFRREALIANRIRHPGVVPIIDDNVADDGSTFLVMPLLVGETVRARALRWPGEKLPVEDVIVIVYALLDILEAAHASKIAHRDIKPDNIFITTNGDIRVFDFGIAGFFDGDESGAVTRSGQAMGTPAFMAPEQALGRTREIDAQTDLWGIGATMFTLLSGRPVHDAESAGEYLVRTATTPPRALVTVAPEVPSAVRDVVDRALAFGKRGRWPDATTMKHALAAACESALGVSPSALAGLVSRCQEQPAQVQERTTLPPTRRRPMVSRSGTRWIAVATALCTLILVGGSLRLVRPAKAPPSTAPSNPENATSSERREANVAFEGGLQLWENACTEAAQRKFELAAQLDPGLAAAHLFFAATSEVFEHSARTHFATAESLRERLSPVQKGLLEALEPLAGEPPNHSLTAERLEALTNRFPSDSVVWGIRAFHDVRTRAPDRLISILDRVPGAIGFWFRSQAELYRGKVAEGRSALEACVREAPKGGVDCLRSLARLEANEGACEESAVAARRLITIDSESPAGYASLARAEFGRTHRTDTVRAMLEEKWARVPESSRDLERHRDEFFLAVLDGEFDRAYAALDGWDKAASKRIDATQRARPFLARMDLDLELGRTDAARQAAGAFIEASRTWMGSNYYDQSIETTRALYRTGLIDRADFLRRRTADEATERAQGGVFASPGTRWYSTYVEPVVTEQDAKLAVANRPSASPILDAEKREVNMDMEIGRTYLYAGEVDRALVELGRAAKSCLYWKSLHLVRAHALNGDALAKSGQPAEACKEYAYVLERWGREPRSRSANAARMAADHLACPKIADARELAFPPPARRRMDPASP